MQERLSFDWLPALRPQSAVKLALAFLLIVLTLVTAPTGNAGQRDEARCIVSGHLALVWSDAPPSSGIRPSLEATLYTDDGRTIQLSKRAGSTFQEIDFLALDRTYIRATGSWQGIAGGSDLIVVDSVQPSRLPLAAKRLIGDGYRGGLRGSKRFVTIKVRYPDSPVVPLPDPEYFESMLVGSKGTSLDEYWREVSYGEIDLAGSEVVGWYTLPKRRSEYILSDNQTVGVHAIAIDAVALADLDVDFEGVYGINIVFDTDISDSARGGTVKVNVDGADRYLGATWLPPWAWRSHSVSAHEIGHAFQLPHSRGPYGRDYDSIWDVMSKTLEGCDPVEAPFGCLGQHTIAAYKDWLGWISDERRYVAAPSSLQTIDIETAEATPTGSGFLLAIVPVDAGMPSYLTVEARASYGFDSILPLQGIVLHRVIPTYAVGAVVIDQSLNGDPNDEGAVLTEGESFVEDGVSIRVVEKTPTGYRVEIARDNGDDGPCTDAVVPADHWRGEYFAREFVQAVPLVVRDDGDGFLHSAPGAAGSAPECGLPLGGIQVRWVRNLTLAKGFYRFTLTSRGTTRFFVDGQPVLDEWINYEPSPATRDVALPAGDHRLIVQYRPVFADPLLSLHWDDVTRFLISADVAPVTLRIRKKAKITIAIERRPGVIGAITVEAPDTSSIGLRIKKPVIVTEDNSVRFRIAALKDAKIGTYDLAFRGYDADGLERTTTVRVVVRR